MFGFENKIFDTALNFIQINVHFSGLKNSQKANYAKWDDIDQFRLCEAAQLWVDQEPDLESDKINRRARKKLKELETAVKEAWSRPSLGSLNIGDISIADDQIVALDPRSSITEILDQKKSFDWKYPLDDARPVSAATAVGRIALLKYAEALGQRPKFLYPAERFIS